MSTWTRPAGRLILRSGARSAEVGIPRPGSRGAPSRSRPGALRRCGSSEPNRSPTGSRPTSGRTAAWCSPRRLVPRWMRPTSGETFGAPSPWYPALTPEEWTPRELRHSFVSVLSDAGIRSSRSRSSSAQRYYRYRTGLPAPATTCHPYGCDRHGSPVRSGFRVGLVRQIVRQRGRIGDRGGAKVPLTWVGDSGFEPVTSSV